MLTIQFGYKKPQTGDRGSVWFPAIEQDIQQLATHNHNGSNSSKIPPSAIDKGDFLQSFLAADWVSDGGGYYHIDVTVPSGVLDIDEFFLKFYAGNTVGDITAGDFIFGLSVDWLSDTTFRVSGNDNSIALNILYV